MNRARSTGSTDIRTAMMDREDSSNPSYFSYATSNSQDSFDRLKKAVDSLSQSIHRLASAQLQVQSRLDSVEVAQRDSASAVDRMTTTICADLQTIQQHSSQEICDFLGSQFQKILQGSYTQSYPPAQQEDASGLQARDQLELLRTFIQQEFQSLKTSALSQAHVSSQDAPKAYISSVEASACAEVCASSKDAAAMAPDEETQIVLEFTDSQRADESHHVGELWEDLQVSVNDYEDHHNAYHRITKRIKQESRSLWHRLFKHFGIMHLLDTEMPKGSLAKLTESPIFTTCKTFLILSNTALMGYETDAAIKAALQDPKGEKPAWLSICNLLFNAMFTVELLFRILALRTWFFVSPKDWGWNFFDVAVVVSSLGTELMGGVNICYIRTFRILRAVRAVRVIRVLRFFRELRKILLSILACMSALVWCFGFLAMTMFMFSILTLQGIVDALDHMDQNSAEHENASRLAEEWYGSLGDAMFTLLATFTCGTDFFTFYDPIKPAGVLYSAAYVIYVLFVMMGVMNVLTGVFLAAAESFHDRSLLVMSEQMAQEEFVLSMLEVFEECDIDRSGIITWAEFSEALKDENLQAFLSAHQLEVTHARLIFDTIDAAGTGEVGIMQFVMGMLSLKGEAKAVDARIIQREIGMLPTFFNPDLLNGEYTNRKAYQSSRHPLNN